MIGLPVPGIELKLVPQRRQARGALARPQRHARLLARARADRGGASTKKASTASATRCKFVDPSDPAAGLRFRRPHRRGLQALDRHLGQRRPAARAADRGAARPCARRRDRRPRPRRRRRADLPDLDGLPRARPACRPQAPPTVLPQPAVRAALRARCRRCAPGQHRQRDARGPRAAAGRAALDRRRRDHRQGLDQPARRARTVAPICVAASYAEPPPADVIRVEETPMSRRVPALLAILARCLAARRRAHAVRRLYRRASRRSRRSISASRPRAPCSSAPRMPPDDVGTVIAGSMAQASFDAYMLPRHVGLYAGVPIEVPAHLVQRVCGTGIEAIMQAADAVTHRSVDARARASAPKCMSRNPVAAYTHRNGFRMGQVEFKDFLWEALLDPACGCTMGDTAENLARHYQHHRARRSTPSPRAASRARWRRRQSGFLAGEIVPVVSETFEREGYRRPRHPAAARHRGGGRRQPCAALAGRSAGARSGPRSAACRPAATAPPWSMARRRRWSCSGAYVRAQGTHAAGAPRRRRRRSAARRRSWASARCRRSAPCWTRAGLRSATSTASRSTRRSARR